jgi:cation diffusion facilitator family transporter
MDGQPHRAPAHAHGHVDPATLRSRQGLVAVATSLALLGVTAAVQGAIFLTTNSVALLADVIHNAGDALTALPLAVAFALRNRRVERWAGVAVVAAILVSALVAGGEAIHRLVSPQAPEHLVVLAVAGVVGAAGNALVSLVRVRAGRRLDSPALVADGQHARADALISLAVVASAICVGLGAELADPLISLGITLVILRVTYQSWQIVRKDSIHSA